MPRKKEGEDGAKGKLLIDFEGDGLAEIPLGPIKQGQIIILPPLGRGIEEKEEEIISED